jgi:four helix bundle protein
MDEQAFKKRTKALALRVIRVAEALSRSDAGRVIGKQLMRSGTSVGSNYRAACRAKSRADLVAKLQIVEEEADETLYWLELVTESGLMEEEKLKPLMQEVEEVLAMVVASINTLKTGRASN